MEDHAFRALRVEEIAPKTFALPPSAQPLRSDAPGSMRDFVLWAGNDFHFRVAAEIGPDSLGAYIISMAEAPSDVLAVEFLQQQTGLNLRVVPLFEQVDSLRAAAGTMRDLLAIPEYRERLAAHSGADTSSSYGDALPYPENASTLVAQQVPGIDAIIGAHSHTRLKTPKVVNGVIICQTGSNCENLGEVGLTVENKKVTHFEGKLHSLWVRHPQVDNAVSKLVEEYKTRIDKEYGEVIGTLATDWKRGGRDESNIGNFMVDAIREGGNADLCIANSSSLRKDLSAGPIRKLDLFEIMPFRNTLCTFTMTGKEVKAFAQRYAQAVADGGSSTQVSGLKCTWKRSPDGVTIQHLAINNNEVDDLKTYTCATSDFAVNQADKYFGFVPVNVHYADTTIFQTLLAKVLREKSVNSQIERRFEEVH